MASLTVLYAALAALAGLASAGMPQCDNTIIGALSTLFPNGLLTNLSGTLMPYGVLSYVYVSSTETSLYGLPVKCMGIQVTSSTTGKVVYKLSLLPSLSMSFPISEQPGYITQTINSGGLKLFVLFLKDGVCCTYRCCDTCTGSEPNVGCAVADKLKNTAATKAALVEGLKVMTSLNLMGDIATLSHCT